MAAPHHWPTANDCAIDTAACEDVEHRHFEKFGKGSFLYDFMYDLGGNGMVMVDGDLWAHQRKTAAKLQLPCHPRAHDSNR